MRALGRASPLNLTFAEIERVLEARLPKSARLYQAWWANQRGAGHVQTRGWLDAGFNTSDLDLKGQRVTFVPVALAREPRGVGRPGAKLALTIEQAKRAVAHHYRVASDAVEITIRG